jgi:hypothetical protein
MLNPISYHQGVNTIDMKTSNLSNGMYLFSLIYNGKKYTSRVMIHD